MITCNSRIISVFVAIAFIGLSRVSEAQTTRPLEPETAFSKLVALSPKKIEYYEAVVQCRSAAKSLGYDGLMTSVMAWGDPNSRAKLLGILGTDVIGDYQIARFVAPLLDSTDAGQRQLAQEYFSAIRFQDGTLVEHAERAQALTEFTRESLGNPSHPAYKLMFNADPLFAVTALASGLGKERTQLDVSIHRVEFAAWFYRRASQSNEGLEMAKRELSKLSSSEHWWVRLYAAEMARRYEAFRDDDLLKALRNDKVAVVASTVDAPFYAGMSEDEFKGLKRENPLLRGRF